MEHRVKIHKKGKIIETQVENGTNLMKFMKQNSLNVNDSCGGRGSCGKCKVTVDGLPPVKSPKEKKLLGMKAMEKGYRLACYNLIKSDLEIYMDNKKEIKSHEPINRTPQRESPSLSRALVSMDHKLFYIEKENASKNHYGMAINIGTTLLEASLYNLNSDTKLGTSSIENPYRPMEKMVPTKTEETLDEINDGQELNKIFVESVNELLETLCLRNEISCTEIYLVILRGSAPFGTQKAKEIGLKTNPYGIAVTMPLEAAQIDANTLGALWGSGMGESKKVSLLVLWGTRIQIALGDKSRIFVVSIPPLPSMEGDDELSGIEAMATLLKQSGIKLSQIEQVYFLGASDDGGELEEAVKMGFIPEKLKKKVKSIDMDLWEDASPGLVSSRTLKKLDKFKKNIHLILWTPKVQKENVKQHGKED